MRGISSTEDKSTLDSESKKERRLDSNGTGDDHSKTNGSRYSKRKMTPGKFNDTQIDDRSPIEYQLSNEHFVRLGWTVLPVAKIMRKIIQYQAKPAKPHLDWYVNPVNTDSDVIVSRILDLTTHQTTYV
ncbi:hypothetical protein K0M31_016222 [Melipona bicolor]|uniref:Uncharacterized protein n=1 Tax=Melipona bicolor TaxID=60889 RepID=A0AA40G6Z2_9HYME|nr:hypothetical protein K0M31_016222 [Melipona bicolor]